MINYKQIMIVLCLALLLGGCAKDSVVLLADPDGHVGSIAITPKQNGEQAQILDQEGYSSSVDTSGKVSEAKKLDTAQIEKIYGKALAAQPDPPAVFILHFRFGTSQLTSQSRELLPDIVKTILDRQSTDVSVVGHTDTMGAARVNYTLSLRRAKRTAAILKDLGVDPNVINVNSHGETVLLIPTKDGVSEPKNRRVEVTVR